MQIKYIVPQWLRDEILISKAKTAGIILLIVFASDVSRWVSVAALLLLLAASSLGTMVDKTIKPAEKWLRGGILAAVPLILFVLAAWMTGTSNRDILGIVTFIGVAAFWLRWNNPPRFTSYG